MTEELSEESGSQEKETKEKSKQNSECSGSGQQLLSSGPLSGAVLTREDSTLIPCPQTLCFHFSCRTKNKKPAAAGSQIISTLKPPPQKQFVRKKSVAKGQDPLRFSSVAQSCLALCDPTNRSTPGLPVHHKLPEFTQTHAHRVGDAIQPSHPLSSPSPPAPNPYQHQGLFQ